MESRCALKNSTLSRCAITGPNLGQCVACNNITSSSDCYANTPNTPVCSTTNVCVECSLNTTCSAISAAPVCQIENESYGPNCVTCNYDNDCSLFYANTSLTSPNPFCVNYSCSATPLAQLNTFVLTSTFTQTYNPNFANTYSTDYVNFVAQYKSFVSSIINHSLIIL